MESKARKYSHKDWTNETEQIKRAKMLHAINTYTVNTLVILLGFIVHLIFAFSQASSRTLLVTTSG